MKAKIWLIFMVVTMALCLMPITVSADWVKTGNSVSYENKNGKKVIGIVEIDGNTYYFDKSGKMRTSTWITKKDGTKYYFKKDGTMAVGWQKLSNNYYYFDKSGKMQKCKWITIKGNQYYLKDTGIMATGQTKIDGTSYYFSSNGKLINVENPINGLKFGMTKNEVISNLGIKKDEYHMEGSTLCVLPTSPRENEEIILYVYKFTDKKLSSYGKIGNYSKETLNYLKNDLSNDGWKTYTSDSYKEKDKTIFYKKGDKRAIVTVKNNLVYFIVS